MKLPTLSLVGLLLVVSLLLEGGVASGWWPLGWPQPWFGTSVLVTAWWLPLHWHTALSVGGASLLDGLQGQAHFPTTRLVCALVIVTSLIKLNTNWQPNRLRVQWLIAGWLIMVALLPLPGRMAGVTWPVLLSFGLQVLLGLGIWWWLVRRLGEPTISPR